MLVGTDVYVRMVFVWEETGVPRGNLPVWLGDHMMHLIYMDRDLGKPGLMTKTSIFIFRHFQSTISFMIQVPKELCRLFF